MAYITLNKNRFFNNLDIISKRTYGKDKIALVLKDNAYGHGLLEVARMAKEYGIKKAVVRSCAEAKKVEDFFEYVLVLAELPSDEIYSEKIHYTINDLKDIKKIPKTTLVELKVNTGMNRNGIQMHELDLAMSMIEEQGLKINAVFTHYSCADEINDYYDFQKKNFEKTKEQCSKNLSFHSCNSAALFREDDFNEDMVRVGIAAYGCMELPEELDNGAKKLEPILSVYAKKIATRHLKKGQSVGYGATFTAEDDCIVSSYDFGYADGFIRLCSHIHTTPNRVQIVGRISMDNSSFLSEENELLVFDDARVLADNANTISYEVLTSLKASLQREIV